ncbi:TPA: glycosyltransferase [Photobacterium damselae]|uniref:glycosyltransferase n=1 Tax=Photobacterium damselae TaxID=38293 RepID=UPI00370BE142
MSNVKRVVYIVTGLGMGGAERQVIDIADEISLMDIEVMIISLTGHSVIMPKNENIKVLEINMTKNFVSLFRSLLKVKKIITDFKPQIIHSHMVHANLFARLLKLMGLKFYLICTAHNTNEGGIKRIISYRLTDSLSDLNTNVSEEATSAFIKSGAVPKNRMITVSNGIDTNKFHYSLANRISKRKELNLSDETHLLLAVGRLEPQKDYPNMLEAFSLLVNENRNVCLVIIGQGYLLDDLTNLVNDLNINDKVRFLGLQTDVEKWLSAADFYVMSSAYEGLPLVIAEAMASECFIISTDCGGVKEMIDGNGILVPPHDSKALFIAMNDALQLTEQRRKEIAFLSKTDVVNRYSLSSVVKTWIKLYKNEK